MIAYLDTSALVKLFLVENGSRSAREIWDSSVHVATSRVAHAELACALAAAVRDRRYVEVRVDRDVVDGAFLHDRAELVEADESIVGLAAIVGVRRGLSSLDAIHVASAMRLADFDPVLVSWDERQRHAARAEGLSVYPETTTAALR